MCVCIALVWKNGLAEYWSLNKNQSSINQLNSSSYRRLYQLNNSTTPLNVSLTINTVKDNTSTQCVVHSTSNITSRLGTITTISMVINFLCCVCMYVCMCVLMCMDYVLAYGTVQKQRHTRMHFTRK